MNKRIESLENTTVKNLLRLREKSRFRRSEQKVLIEGIQEIQLAITNNYVITELFICVEILPYTNFEDEFRHLIQKNVVVTEVSHKVYKRLAYRTSTQGLLAIAETKSFDLKNLNLPENPLILVAEAPEKPGNIGALLRTSDAANVDAVLIANPKTDLYNANIIRSSVGCLFSNQIATGTTTEIISFLQEKAINIYGAILQSSTSYHLQDYTKPTAIVMGTEHDGLSEEWRQHTTQNIIIPMSGAIDSMNVSVAAGIIIFEAKRQRGFN